MGAAALFLVATPAGAQDVQAGIAAWQSGDYAAAVQQWRPLADGGNADAQFNLAQAYRLGRGVAQNLNLAEQWFERAARQRHEQAGASLGLLLFQNGRAREAMPWLQAAAGRGDPRAQYVFGTALFNGDIVRRDLPRAYALMRAAATQGFPQAQEQLTAMEQQLSPEDRQRGDAMAAEIATPPSRPPAVDGPAPTQVARAEPPRETPRETVPPAPPRPRPSAGVSYDPPSEDGRPAPAPRPTPAPPRETRPVQTAERPAERPRTRPGQAAERPRPTSPARSERPAPATTGGSWRVQLGAFSNEANARRRWTELSRRVAALRGIPVSYPRAGNVVRVRAGGYASREAANRVCVSVRAAGGECIALR